MFHLRTEGKCLVGFFPRCRLEVAEIVLSIGVCALPVPRFRHASEVYDGGIVEQGGVGRFGECFVAHKAFAVEEVLRIPGRVDEIHLSVQYDVEQILVVVDDAFGVGGEVGRTLGEHFVVSPQGQVQEEHTRIKVALTFGELQSFVVLCRDVSVVFHGRNVPIIQRSVVKRVEGLAYDHVAVEIEHAFQLFGEQVGEETTIVGGCREAGGGVDTKAHRSVGRRGVDVEQTVVSADKEAQPRQISRGDALGDEVHMHDAVRVILEHRRDGGNGVCEIIAVRATGDV